MADAETKSFYNSAEWLHKRAEILARDHWECQRCKEQGEFAKAVVVHHIKHYKARKDLALIDDNLISLCLSCHDDVHPEKLRRNAAAKTINEEKW